MSSPGRSCCMCIHCGDGIPYNKYYFNCMKCDLTICNSCLSSHPRSHREFLKKAIDKARGRDDTPDEKDCAVCMQMVDTRIQCNDCELAVCYNCWGEPAGQNKFAEHEHKGLTFCRIPDDYGLDYYELECLSCQFGASFSHCGRCFEGIKDGEVLYECLTCMRKYVDVTPAPCSTCLPIVTADHDSTHTFISILFKEVVEVDPDACIVKCLDCNKELKDFATSTIYRHKHTNYQFSIGKYESEWRKFKQYRKCPRHAVKDIDLSPEELNDRSLSCNVCFEVFPKNSKFYICRQCRNFQTCARCEEGGVVNHRHPLLGMSLKTTPIDDEMYKEIVLGTLDRDCDICKETFKPSITNYLQCPTCCNYDVCNSCLWPYETESPVLDLKWVLRHSCPTTGKLTRNFTFWMVPNKSEEWMEEQVRLAGEFVAQVQEAAEAEAVEEAERQAEAAAAAERNRREREEAERRARVEADRVAKEKREKELQSARMKSLETGIARKPIGGKGIRDLLSTPSTNTSRIRAPSPNPGRLVVPQPQVQRRKSSSGLGTALLKGALAIGAGISKAEVRQMNGNNGGWNGGGGGGGGGFNMDNNGGGGMDMSSFWAPINSAAQDPIQ